MNLTSLDLDAASRSLVYCSHVLEHIPDDRKAIAEMRRVLVRGGHAVIQVPIRGVVTDEDPSVTDPNERLRRYSQRDHVRFYGLDVAQRLTEGGFAVETLTALDLPGDLVSRHAAAYPTTREVFLCRAL